MKKLVNGGAKPASKIEVWLQFFMLLVALVGGLMLNERRVTRIETLLEAHLKEFTSYVLPHLIIGPPAPNERNPNQ